MNIFVLDLEPEKCAKYHNDRHCSKMILESAQLLSTTVRSFDINVGYKSTHINHPCSKWLRESFQNFIWLSDLIFELHKEFQYRFENEHKSYLMIEKEINPLELIVFEKYQKFDLETRNMTPFALAMPDQYKTESVVESYRKYYLNDKRHLAKWTKREPPDWWI